MPNSLCAYLGPRRNATVGALLYLGALAYVLLHPGEGAGATDSALFPVDQISLYLVIAAQLFLGILLLSAWDKRAGMEPVLIGRLLIAFVLVVDVRAIWTGADADALVAANISLACTCFLLSCELSRGWGAFKAFPWVLAVVLGVYSLIVLQARLFPVRLSVGEIYHFATEARLSALFDQPNHLGNVLSFGVLFCYPGAALSRRRLPSIILWTLLAVLALGLIMTYSRGAWLGCAVGLVTCIAYLSKRMATRELVRSVVVLALVIVIAVAVGPHRHLADRVIASTPLEDDSVGHRLAVWDGAAHMIHDHWLVGVGISRFGQVLDKGYKPESVQKESYSTAINNYLTLAAEGGIPALAIYLAALICACIAASRRIPASGGTAGIQIGMLCGVYSMLIFGMTTYTLARVYAVVLSWSVLGYLAGRPAVTPGENSFPSMEKP